MSSVIDVRDLTSRLAVDSPVWLAPVVLDSVDSTNAEAGRRGRLWQPVLADEQTQGRGRLGRPWQSPKGAGVALSCLVPAPPDRLLGWLPLLAGLAVHHAAAEAGVGTALKWPNDVLVPAQGERKLCGVLCERVREGVVVGIGLNVHHEADQLPVETATSLRLAGAAGDVDRADLVVSVLSHLRRHLEALMAGGPALEEAQQSYRAACGTIGADLAVHRPDGSVLEARGVQVDDSGGLEVRSAAGSATVTAGDVVHVRRRPSR